VNVKANDRNHDGVVGNKAYSKCKKMEKLKH
jgi:hypothetical protein